MPLDSSADIDTSEQNTLIRAVDSSLNGDAGHSSTTSNHPAQPAEQNLETEDGSSPSDDNYLSFQFLELRGLPFLPRENVTSLRAKGCLKVPDRAATDDFMKQYFLHVHPIVPVLDEAEFWSTYAEPGRHSSPDLRKLSLFVFQAMLFASCPVPRCPKSLPTRRS